MPFFSYGTYTIRQPLWKWRRTCRRAERRARRRDAKRGQEMNI